MRKFAAEASRRAVGRPRKVKDLEAELARGDAPTGEKRMDSNLMRSSTFYKWTVGKNRSISVNYSPSLLPNFSAALKCLRMIRLALLNN